MPNGVPVVVTAAGAAVVTIAGAEVVATPDGGRHAEEKRSGDKGGNGGVGSNAPNLPEDAPGPSNAGQKRPAMDETGGAVELTAGGGQHMRKR